MKVGALIFSFFFSSFASALAETAPKELTLKSIAFVDTKHELSGAAVFQGKIHIVANGKKDHFVYKLWENDGRLDLKKSIKLKKIDGFKAYMRDLKEHEQRTDFEGLASCESELFIADERSGDVLRVDDDSVESLGLSLKEVPRWRDGGENSGIEGIAVDCDSTC